MIHHNHTTYIHNIIHYDNGVRVPPPYGVSPAMRVLSPQTLIKRHANVVKYLTLSLSLTPSETEIVLYLLRLWSYYGQIYPKQHQITDQTACSKPTVWRTVKHLADNQLITVVNRYVKREKAQISNLYILDRLILAIAKYLNEHGQPFTDTWLSPWLRLDWQEFWRATQALTMLLHPPPKPA
jgi:hypothetical protein